VGSTGQQANNIPYIDKLTVECTRYGVIANYNRTQLYNENGENATPLEDYVKLHYPATTLPLYLIYSRIYYHSNDSTSRQINDNLD
jgi:hypothetical protein